MFFLRQLFQLCAKQRKSKSNWNKNKKKNMDGWMDDSVSMAVCVCVCDIKSNSKTTTTTTLNVNRLMMVIVLVLLTYMICIYCATKCDTTWNRNISNIKCDRMKQTDKSDIELKRSKSKKKIQRRMSMMNTVTGSCWLYFIHFLLWL